MIKILEEFQFTKTGIDLPQGSEYQREYRKRYRDRILYNQESIIRTKCEICGIENNKLCADHNHNTNKFRGVLCQNCNLILGHAHDDISILEKAIEYLNERP